MPTRRMYDLPVWLTRLVCSRAVAFPATVLLMVSVGPTLVGQQRPTRVISLALENITLECEADGTLTRIESRAIEPVKGREPEADAARRARDRVVGQLSRFLANERGASQALQLSAARMTPPLGGEAVNRLSASLTTVARNYQARTLALPDIRGTKSSDGTMLSVTATLKAPFTGAPSPGPEAGSVQGGVEGGKPAGVVGSVVGGLTGAPPPPPPSAPIKLGDNVTPPTRVTHVPPVYPAIAQSARISGTVTLEATIGADGKVKDAKVIKSIPLLDQAAIDAVKQWEFTPTRLNGVAVPVIITVTVDFTLK